MTLRVLTGIKPTGTPHLGNYVGAIRPAVRASVAPGVASFYFLADYHALTGAADPARVHRSTLEVAASWLACGLDPERVHFYRQSDLPEVTELTWLLMCVTAKGLLNRAHAYKAAVDANLEAGAEADAGIGAGLYAYPVLMAADILLFNAHKVPVGRDQVQHIEIARDLAQRFNHLYGGEYFTLPEAAIEESAAVLPGLDGRKMSKSYDNVIPLWGTSKALKEAVYSIVTNSQAPGEPKDTEGSALFLIYKAFASAEETAQLAADYAAGIAWGEVKRRLYEHLEHELAPARDRSQSLITPPARLDEILAAGAERLRPQARELLARLRDAVGLRPLAKLAAATPAAKPAAKGKLPRFVQFRLPDGRFDFKFNDPDGALLLAGVGYADARDCGRAIAAIKAADPSALAIDGHGGVQLDGTAIGMAGEGGLDALRTALAALRAAEA
jgi:tryptophanyl-tRNA synthetase